MFPNLDIESHCIAKMPRDPNVSIHYVVQFNLVSNPGWHDYAQPHAALPDAQFVAQKMAHQNCHVRIVERTITDRVTGWQPVKATRKNRRKA